MMVKINEGRILRRAREKTNRENTQDLAKAMHKMTPSDMADFILDNFDLIAPYAGKKHNLDDIRTTLKEGTKADSLKMRGETAPFLDKVIRKIGYQNLQVQNVALKFQDAEKVGAYNVKKRKQAAKNREKDIGALKNGASTLAYSLARLSGRTISYTAGSLNDLRLGTKGVGNLIMGMGHLLLGRKTWKTLSVAGLTGIGIWGAAPVDVAAEYPALLNSAAKSAFRQACLDHPEASRSRSNAAYAIAMYPKTGDSIARYVYDGSWAAARHGVPPQIIAEFVEFESYSGKLVMSPLSSASNPLQVIDQMKLRLAGRNGKDTYDYKEAQARYQNGHASASDRTILNAIDFVAELSDKELDYYSANPTKMSGPILEVMRRADNFAFTVELFALDFKKTMPKEIVAKLPFMSPLEIHHVSTQHYARNHNLGASNTNAIKKIIAYNNEHGTSLSLTDPKVADIVGTRQANVLKQVVKYNPSLQEAGLPANKVFDNMGAKFSYRVKPLTTKINAAYQAATSAAGICTDPTKVSDDISATMPRYEAAARDVYQARVPDAAKEALRSGFHLAQNFVLKFSPGTMARDDAPIRMINGIPVPTPRPSH